MLVLTEKHPKMFQMCRHSRGAWSPCWSWFGCLFFFRYSSLVVRSFNFCDLNGMYCCKVMPISSGYTGPSETWNVVVLYPRMYAKYLYLVALLSYDMGSNDPSCFCSLLSEVLAVCWVPSYPDTMVLTVCSALKKLNPERLRLSGLVHLFYNVKWIVQLCGC